MENVLFKISFPAEFHAQTAVEAAMHLHAQLASAASPPTPSSSITIRTHEACLRIIDKKGPLANPADRDHCIQYMVAVPLLFGRLTAADYEDADRLPIPRIDALRAKITLRRRARSSPPTTTTPKSAPSPTHSASNSTTAPSSRKQSSTPSATAAAAQKACRCSSRNSKPTSAAASPKCSNNRSSPLSLDRARLESTPVNEYVDLYVV